MANNSLSRMVVSSSHQNNVDIVQREKSCWLLYALLDHLSIIWLVDSSVRIDHCSLTWLLGFKEPQGQLARWMKELGQYDMVIKHRPGKNHGNADGLSRIDKEEDACPNYLSGVRLKNLPYRGCKYCQKAHEAWTEFILDVDEAVSLTKRKRAYYCQL